MAATRKLYCDLADRLRQLLDQDDICKDTVAATARTIATGLKIDNPQFRYDTFYEACGLDYFGYVKGTVHT